MINRLIIFSSVVCMLFMWGTALGQSPAGQVPSGETATHNAGARAIAALRRLDRDVVVYRSLGDFEEGRKLVLVPIATLEQQLSDVNAELQPLLSEMPAGAFKSRLTNALDSFRDGVFWWRQIDQPRVVSVSALAASGETHSPADVAFVATMPYTVAIHWRQAHAYLNQSEKLLHESARTDARQALR